MFFLIKFIILAVFLMVFFFVPLGSKPMYSHVKAIWSTPPAQEMKQEFLKNMIQLETWVDAHKALGGETLPGQQDSPPEMVAPKQNDKSGPKESTPPAADPMEPSTDMAAVLPKPEKTPSRAPAGRQKKNRLSHTGESR